VARKRTYDFDLDARLLEQRERNLGVDVPIPVSERIDTLTDLLYSDGHGPVARKELIAALLHTCPSEPEALAERLTQYRKARVRDTHVGEMPTGNVISFQKRAPGPRARTK
jgi:hypothetical protein